MNTSLSVSSANNQVDSCPLVIKISQPVSGISMVFPENNEDLEKRLATVSLDVISVIETITEEMSATQGNMQQLTNANLRLLAENSLLSQQLVASNGRESEISRVHNVQEEALRAQIASMQAQMAAQAAQAEAQAQRSHELLLTAQREKIEGIAAAQAVWQQQETEMNQQKKMLHDQLTALNTKITVLENKVTCLTHGIETRDAHMKGERQRVEEVIKKEHERLRNNLKASFDYNLNWYARKPTTVEIALNDMKNRVDLYIR